MIKLSSEQDEWLNSIDAEDVYEDLGLYDTADE